MGICFSSFDGDGQDYPSIPYFDSSDPIRVGYWQNWLAYEQVSLPARQAEFNSKTDIPFVQITGEHASSFYGLKSYEMEQVLPRRPFYHDGIYGNAYEHRAVRRMAYIRVAYLSGFYGDEAFQYHNGRCTLNQKIDTLLASGIILDSIVLFRSTNNQNYNFAYHKLETKGDTRAHERYD